MNLRPQSETEKPSYPHLKRFATARNARRVLRRVAMALLASSALLMVACPGAMIPVRHPSSGDAGPDGGGYEDIGEKKDTIQRLGLIQPHYDAQLVVAPAITLER